MCSPQPSLSTLSNGTVYRTSLWLQIPPPCKCLLRLNIQFPSLPLASVLNFHLLVGCPDWHLKVNMLKMKFIFPMKSAPLPNRYSKWCITKFPRTQAQNLRSIFTSTLSLPSPSSSHPHRCPMLSTLYLYSLFHLSLYPPHITITTPV